MKDRDFLIWIHGRLENVYGEDPNVDHMHKLRAVIKAMPSQKETQNVSAHNNLDDLLKDLDSYDEADFVLMINESLNRAGFLKDWERSMLSTALNMTDKRIMLSEKQRNRIPKIWKRVTGL